MKDKINSVPYTSDSDMDKAKWKITYKDGKTEIFVGHADEAFDHAHKKAKIFSAERVEEPTK